MKLKIILCLLVFALLSFCTPSCDFSKTEWNEAIDTEAYLFRDCMLGNVLKMRLLNKSKTDIIKLLGEPNEEFSKMRHEICYFIEREYSQGLMLEPLKAKILVFSFNEEELCLSYEVEYRY